MDPTLTILFDGRPGIAFTQGEDRLIQLEVSNKADGTPIDLSAARMSVNFPRQVGGVIKRTSYALTVSASNVQPGLGISLTDHGLADQDPVNIVGGSLPAPLNFAAYYNAQFIDPNTFGFYDNTGTPVALTTAGSGTFTVGAQAVQFNAPTAGQAQLALAANATGQITPALGQDFEVVITIGGKTRIVPVRRGLDVGAQPTP